MVGHKQRRNRITDTTESALGNFCMTSSCKDENPSRILLLLDQIYVDRYTFKYQTYIGHLKISSLSRSINFDVFSSKKLRFLSTCSGFILSSISGSIYAFLVKLDNTVGDKLHDEIYLQFTRRHFTNLRYQRQYCRLEIFETRVFVRELPEHQLRDKTTLPKQLIWLVYRRKVNNRCTNR